MFERIQNALSEDSKRGLLARVIVFCVGMLALLALSWGASRSFSVDIPFRELLAVFFAVAIPMTASIVVGELPRGNDWIMMRLALATFCRTGLPIFCVVVITLLSEKQLQPLSSGFLVLFYIFGLLSVVLISVRRLKQNSVEPAKKR